MNTEVTRESDHGLGYSGQVDIKIVDGDRTIYNYSGHNAGTVNLFRFFSSCLAGDWAAAKQLRPCKLIFFKEDVDNGESLLTTEPVFNKQYWGSSAQASAAIYYDNAPLVTVAGGESRLTYHFRVPFLFLTAGAEIRKLALYPNTITALTGTSPGESDVGNMLAYYILPEANKISVPESGGNYTIIINWTLTVKNA